MLSKEDAEAKSLTPKEIKKLIQALIFYADPESYFAIAFLPDPPCGAFIRDFSDDHGDDNLPGFRPGKKARKVLQELGLDWHE